MVVCFDAVEVEASLSRSPENWPHGPGRGRGRQLSAPISTSSFSHFDYLTATISTFHCIARSRFREAKQCSAYKMINAVLVFNNNGQPRLTKFYTTLVYPYLRYPRAYTHTNQPANPHHSGYPNPTIPHRANIPLSRAASLQCLQLPPPPTPPLPRRGQLNRALRRANPNNLPHLRDALLHYDLHLDRVPARADRSHPGLCRGIRSYVRECLRAGLDLWV